MPDLNFGVFGGGSNLPVKQKPRINFNYASLARIFDSNKNSVGPVEEGDDMYETLCRLSSIAIEEYNGEHNTNYKFVKYVKAECSACAGIKYYITFEAKEDGDESPTTFQALVYNGIPQDTVIQVLLVRKKSEAPILF